MIKLTIFQCNEMIDKLRQHTMELTLIWLGMVALEGKMSRHDYDAA